MRIFLAGATGVIGIRLVPHMLAEGHVVAGATRTPVKTDALRAAGVTPVLCDVFDEKSLLAAVKDFRPDIIVHQVTDLPDEIEGLADFLPRNDRVRSEGTQNLLAAAKAVDAAGFLAQSIAWRSGPGTGPVLDAHEHSVISAGGTVLRYGLFHGPVRGSWVMPSHAADNGSSEPRTDRVDKNRGDCSAFERRQASNCDCDEAGERGESRTPSAGPMRRLIFRYGDAVVGES